MPQETRKFPFRLGADPEFNFVVQNKQTARLRADSLMKDFFRDKRANADGYNITGGNAGWDGNAATGEIRPKPEYAPADLTKNIGALYAQISKRSPQAVKISVRSDTAPVGGHIHFELDSVSRDMSEQKAKIIQKRLSTFYTPIALGEDPANSAIRLQTQYGRFSDGRRDNGKTYEYRTPSAEWQLTPKICEATLAYMGTVWYEAVHRPETFKRFESIYPNDRAGNAIQQLLLSRYAPLARGITSDIKKIIKKFEYYPMFKEEIDYIINYEKVLKEKQEAAFCINLGWGFSEASQPTKKMINNETQIKKNLANIDIDRWLELLRIPFNTDTNVKDFVDALKKRVLAYDWNLANEYFMFGMRKGIKSPIVMDGSGNFRLGVEQFKTIRDKTIVIDTFQRMQTRMGRVHAPAEKRMIVGLPYDARMAKDIRPFIEMVYELEKNPDKFSPASPKDPDLIDDRHLPQDDWGEIARAYSRNEAETIAEESRPRPVIAYLESDAEDDDGNRCGNCGADNHDCDC